jgi:hypothetical protein
MKRVILTEMAFPQKRMVPKGTSSGPGPLALQRVFVQIRAKTVEKMQRKCPPLFSLQRD